MYGNAALMPCTFKKAATHPLKGKTVQPHEVSLAVVVLGSETSLNKGLCSSTTPC